MIVFQATPHGDTSLGVEATSGRIRVTVALKNGVLATALTIAISKTTARDLAQHLLKLAD